MDAAGEYQFKLYSDDASTLHIDDKLVVDQDDAPEANEVESNATTLSTGFYYMKVTYMELSGYQALRAWYKGPDTGNNWAPLKAWLPPSGCVCNAGFTGPVGMPCEACVAGKYKITNGSMPCTQCGAGTFSTAMNATTASTCGACPADSYNASNNTMCMECPAFAHADAGSDERTDCQCGVGFAGPEGGPCRVICADGSGLPCVWGPGFSSSDTCEFSSYSATLSDGGIGLKLARTGKCAAKYGTNELVLRGHGLKELDDNIFHGMSALTKIDISENEIKELPQDICNGLNSLQVFNLSDNNLVTLASSGTFRGCGNLTELVLSNNELRSLPSGAFTGLTALQKLWLHEQTAKGGGFIGTQSPSLIGATLPYDLLSGLSSLTHFSLHTGSVQTLLAGFFTDQSNLLELYLHSNAITCLPSDIFRPLANLTRIDIQGNPDLECGGPIYSWGALGAATSWDGGGCASGSRTWCRPTCSNKYDPGHAGKPNCVYDSSGNVPASVILGDISLQGTNTPPYMPCMWDQCEFRLELTGIPPVVTLKRLGTCSASWHPQTPNIEDGNKPVGSAPDQVNLNFKGIEALETTVFFGMTAMEFLKLGSNHIGALPTGILSGLAGLKRFGFYGNPLTSMPTGIFTGLNLE